MIRYVTFILVMLPFLAFANTTTYEDAAGTSQMLADNITGFWTYLFDDMPSALERFWAWLLQYWVQMKLYAQLELMKFSWGVAKAMIENLSIMSQITAQISVLPIDARQALIDMRLFDAINLLIQAWMTKFVMGTFK